MKPLASIEPLFNAADMSFVCQGFVSNKDAAQLADSDPVERLLYGALVAATSRSNVGHLASILNEDVERLCQVRLSALLATCNAKHQHLASLRCVMHVGAVPSMCAAFCRLSPLRAGWASPPAWPLCTVRDPRSLLTV